MAGDPPSITVSCDRLLSAIREIVTEIADFSRTVRDARRALSLITREIASLELTIKSVEHDVADIQDVPGLDRQFRLILQHCESALKRLSTLLHDLLPGGSKQNTPWALGGQDATTTLKSSLEELRQMLDLNLDLLNMAAPRRAINSPAPVEKVGNSFTDEASEAGTDLSKLRIEEEELPTTPDTYPTMVRSSLSRNLHISEKFIDLPSSTPPRYTRTQQSSTASSCQTPTRSYISQDSFEEKEVVTSPQLSHAATSLQLSHVTTSVQLSHVDLTDVNERLFNAFFVDSDSGHQVLTKYIPCGHLKGLLNQGGDPDAYDVANRRMQNRRGGQPVYQGPGGADLAGSSILALAAVAGDTHAMEILLDRGATIDATRGHLGSALHAAAVFNQGRSVQFLLHRSADPNKMGGSYGYPIIAATRNSDLGVLRVLLDHDVDTNVAFDLYGSVLHAAISESRVGGNSERVQMLLNAGANPNSIHETHGTPLLSACYTDNYSAAHMLLQAGANPNTIHSRRGAALLAAAHRGQIPIASLLMEHGANKEMNSWIDGYEREGPHYDLLSAAISSRRPDVVQWALRSGFGSREYWRSGAFKDSLAKFPLHRGPKNLKIYPMVYNHARQKGYSVSRGRSANPLASLFSLRNHAGD